MPRTNRCMAGDGFGHTREIHKPALGVYDGEPILSCVWCGRELDAPLQNEVGQQKPL
jgi:hypothetical protein